MLAHQALWACALVASAASSAVASAGTTAGGLRRSARATKSDGVGTETVFLLKGGYGVTASLLSTPGQIQVKPPRAVKVSHHTVKAAKVAAKAAAKVAAKAAAPTADSVMEDAGEEMLKATRTAATLTQQLQAAVHQSVVTEDGLRGLKKENAALRAEVGADDAKIAAGAEAAKEHAQLSAQVVRLSADDLASKERAQKVEKELQAYEAKDQSLEQDIRISNHAWEEATQEQDEELKAKQAPKAVPAKVVKEKKVAKAQVSEKKVAKARAQKRMADMKGADAQVKKSDTLAAASKAKKALRKPAASAKRAAPKPAKTAEEAAEDEVGDEDAAEVVSQDSDDGDAQDADVDSDADASPLAAADADADTDTDSDSDQ